MKLSMKINQRDERGREHGYWECYRGNGHLWYKGEYRHGKNHGLMEVYQFDGRIWSKGTYKKNEQIGLWHEVKYEN